MVKKVSGWLLIEVVKVRAERESGGKVKSSVTTATRIAVHEFENLISKKSKKAGSYREARLG